MKQQNLLIEEKLSMHNKDNIQSSCTNPQIFVIREIWLKYCSKNNLAKTRSKSHPSCTLMDGAHLITQPISLLSINVLQLIVSKINPGQDFKSHGHYGKVKGQTKVIP